MTLPLEGCRVLDLSQYLPGPLCSQILADFGAEVIKIEDVGGEQGRYLAPIMGKESSRFYTVNRNKKSLGVNLKSEEGRMIFKDLIRTADVLIEQFRPGAMEKLGLSYEVLKQENPALIHCAITGYGHTGPWRLTGGHDLNYLSITGITGLNGRADEPGLCASQIADIGGGTLYGVIAVLLALLARSQTGKGQFCDVAMADGAFSMLCYTLGEWAGISKLPQRGGELLTGGYACYNVYRTQDERYLSLGAIEPKFWEGFCQRVDRPNFIPLHYNREKQSAMIQEIQGMIAAKTLEQWLQVFDGLDICLTPVLDLEEVTRHPQLNAREMIVKLENVNNTGKDVFLAGVPVKLSETPGVLNLKFPELGEHGVELLHSLGYDQVRIDDLIAKKIIAAPPV
ncbi:MAG TPA: CaiB/BaiF CoA-transferase family protein [Syntrophomonadaceae bacterium]|nr:CaiB/BaiF CoA-transferase family protein [Syntrophomonadaceae bacterium]